MHFVFFGESPVNETGASRVSKYLLQAIIESGHTVEVIGTNHFIEENYDHEQFPFPITGVSCPTKLETYQKAIEIIKDKKCDYVFINDDMHVPQIMMDIVTSRPCIALGAIDGDVHFKEQVNSFSHATIPAVYSKHAYQSVLKVIPELAQKLQCVQLGCEPDTFFPVNEEIRKAYRKKCFGLDDDTFLVMNVNRNQVRKDLARSMKAFSLFNQKYPDSKLYMLTQRHDVGGDLISQAKLVGCNLSSMFFTGDDYNALAGYDREKLNLMYNSADVCISTAQGEGWGLTTTEALTAGRPFIGPNNTSFIEILSPDKGYLVKSGGDDLWSVYYGTDDAPRPLTSVTDMVRTLEYVYHHREEAKQKGLQGRKWAESHTWSQFKDRWKEILWHAQSLLESQGKMVAI